MKKKNNTNIDYNYTYLSIGKLRNVKNGTIVNHSIYGNGVISNINRTQLEVTFEEARYNYESKKFMYPNAFVDGYLKVQKISNL